MSRTLGGVALCAALITTAMAAGAFAAGDAAPAVQVTGDAIPGPLAPAGDVARGRALLVARDSANCVLCHAIPDAALPFAGDVGPSLAGVASRLTPAQIRLRIADNLRVRADTIMPSYYRTDGLNDVAAAYRGRTILRAQDVEDLVAFLGTLR